MAGVVIVAGLTFAALSMGKRNTSGRFTFSAVTFLLICLMVNRNWEVNSGRAWCCLSRNLFALTFTAKRNLSRFRMHKNKSIVVSGSFLGLV